MKAIAGGALGLMLLLFGGWSAVQPAHDVTIAGAASLAGVVVAAAGAIEMRRARPAIPRIVILGAGRMASVLAQALSVHRVAGRLAGIVDDQRPRESSARWLGPVDRIGDIVKDEHADCIVLALPDRRGHLPLNQLLESRVHGVMVEEGLEFYERVTGKIAIESLTPGSLILSKAFLQHRQVERAARFISVVAAVAGLVLLAPVLVIVALAIRLDSKGRVLFVQERAGLNGSAFRLLKFRTMHPTACCLSEWEQDNAARITRVGRWLRRFRLDELPQLVNVLRGEMNLVGPRPHPMSNQRIFMEQIAYYGLRSTVRPGVTGWAQVRYGYANNIDEETEKMRFDLYYIKNRSLWLDARILLATVGIVLRGQRSPVAAPDPVVAPPVASRRPTTPIPVEIP